MSDSDDRVEAEDTTAARTLPATGTPAVSAVNLKLQPFWPGDPEVWFTQVDTHFTTRRVTSQRARFDHVVASLSPEFATEIRDLILKLPAERPYDALREQLFKCTTASEQCKLQQLFSAEELGDRKHTQLLRRIQQLLGDCASTTDSTFLRELFLQRLPNNVRMILASTSGSGGLEELVELANKIMDVAAPSGSVSAVHPQPPPPQLSTEVDQLRVEVTRLQTLVKSLQRRSRTPSRRPVTTRTASPHSTSPTRLSGTNRELCWYHLKYGDSASKCREPCEMSNTLATR